MKRWLHRRFLEPLLLFLGQGMAPPKLALCVSIAIVIGNIPILGVSTITCTLLALIFRLNMAAIQLIQAAMAPSQLLLIIPFMRLGEWIAHAQPEAMSVKAGLALLSGGIWPAVIVLRDAILHAGLAWALVAPLGFCLLYRLLTAVFERMSAESKRAKKYPPNAATPKGP